MRKRLFDIAAAALGLVLLSPLFVVLAVAVKVDSPGPVFFRQARVGRHGRVFLIFKFRTMRHRAEGLEITVGDDRRVTNVGAFLRRYKLDELPQLIDVLRGTMSIVGPRPEVPRYVAHYPPEIRDQIFSVRPGITDRASLRFRNENEILARASDPERAYIDEVLPDKLRHAVEYSQSATLATDLALIAETLTTVFAVRTSHSVLSDLMNAPAAWQKIDRAMAWLHLHRRIVGPVADAGLVVLSWNAAYLFRLGFERFLPARPWYDMLVLVGVVLVYLAMLWLFGNARTLWRFFGLHDVRRLLMACAAAGLVSAVTIQMAQLLAVPRAVLLLHPIFCFGALAIARLLYRLVHEHARAVEDANGASQRRAIVLGAGDVARRLVAGIHRREGWYVTCVLDDDPTLIGSRIGGVPVKGPLEDLLDAEILEDATHVIVALGPESGDQVARAMALAARTGLPILAVPQPGELRAAGPSASEAV